MPRWRSCPRRWWILGALAAYFVPTGSTVIRAAFPDQDTGTRGDRTCAMCLLSSEDQAGGRRQLHEMIRMRRSRGAARGRTGMSVIASVACLLVALAGSAEASPPVAQLTDRTPIAAYGDHLVWSQRDAKTGEFQLIDEVAGSTHILPVRERAVPFDVDLGPDARGTPFAVYSRCKRELWESRDRNSGLIAYGAPTATNADCDLYR